MTLRLTTIVTSTVIIVMFTTSSAMEDDPRNSYLSRVQVPFRKVKPQQQKLPRSNNNSNNDGCPKKCLQCSASNGCVTCQARHFLFFEWQNMRQVGVCLARCPQGYYPNVWNPGERPKKRYGKCSKCTIENCEKCRTRDRCGRCLKPYLLYRGRCLQKCPPRAHLFHPEERKCRKPGQDNECKASKWTSWSKCFYKSSAHCIGLQTRSRFFLYRFNSWGRYNIFKNFDYELEMADSDRRRKGEHWRRSIPLKSANDLPLGTQTGNSSMHDLALYQKFKLNEVIRCPDPEYEYRKCYRKDRFCREI